MKLDSSFITEPVSLSDFRSPDEVSRQASVLSDLTPLDQMTSPARLVQQEQMIQPRIESLEGLAVPISIMEPVPARAESQTHTAVDTQCRSYRYTESEATINQSNQSTDFEYFFEHTHYNATGMGIAAPNLLLLANSDALTSKPAQLTFGDEFDQLSQWSINNPKRRLCVLYKNTNGIDQSGLSKHSLTAAFSTVSKLPIIRQTPDGLRLVPLDEIDGQFLDRGLINRNALKDCAKLGHIFGRLLAQNIKSNKNSNLRIQLKFSPSVYHALYVLANMNDKTTRTLNRLLSYAKNPEKSFPLSLKQLIQHQSTHASPLAILNEIVDLGLKDTLKSESLVRHRIPRLKFLNLSKKLPDKRQLINQIYAHLNEGLMPKDDSEQAIMLSLAEKFAPYLEMAKGFNEVLKGLKIDKKITKDLDSKFYSELNLKQWLAEDENAFDQVFKITGLEIKRAENSKLNELVKAGMIDFLKTYSNETAVTLAHFVTASKAITKETQITLSLHGDAIYDVPQAHTCANQLDVFIGLFEQGSGGSSLFNQNLLLALENYQDDPFGLR